MQAPIIELTKLRRLPDEASVDAATLRRLEQLARSITKPVSDEEARALVRLFGPDDSCYGIAWTLLHLIETAPHWPLRDCLPKNAGEWIELLRIRARNGGYVIED
jgi:hypothetical protein